MQTEYPAKAIAHTAHPAQASPVLPASVSPVAAVGRSMGVVLRRWLGPVAIALALFELIVRTCIYSPRPQVSDGPLGQVPAPGSTWVNGREGFGRIHWNRQGVRARDLPAEEDRSVPRLVVMGDSFCEAEGVDDNQTYCALLEKDLIRDLHREVWVGNCGRPSLDGSDYLFYLPAYDRKFHPDLILISFTMSDLRLTDPHTLAGSVARFDMNANSDDGLVAQPLAETKEHHLLDTNLPGFAQRLTHTFVDNSALALYGAARLYAVAVRKIPQDKFITRDAQIATTAQMERYLSALIARSNAPIACAYISPRNQVWSFNNHFEQLTEQRLRAATAQLNIPFIPTGAAFRRHALETGQPGNGFANTSEGPGYGHLNPIGHRLVAQAMVPSIARLLAGDPPLRSLRVAQVRARAATIGSLPVPPRRSLQCRTLVSAHRELTGSIAR